MSIPSQESKKLTTLIERVKDRGLSSDVDVNHPTEFHTTQQDFLLAPGIYKYIFKELSNLIISCAKS